MSKFEIKFSEKFGQGHVPVDALLRSDPQYPVPGKLRIGRGVSMSANRSGQLFWICASAGVAFTGVLNMKTGLIYLRPLVANREGNVKYDSPFWSIGRESIHAIEHSADAKSLRGTFWEGLPDRTGHKQLAQSAAWDTIIHKFEGNSLNSRYQGFGSDQLFHFEDDYLGFSIIKATGTPGTPHQLRFRSGTFNGKFTDKVFGVGRMKGVTVPKEWADVVVGWLEKNL